MILYVIVEDHDTLFVLSEAVHIIGILVLGYKLLSVKNSGGVCLTSCFALRLSCCELIDVAVLEYQNIRISLRMMYI